MTSLAFANMAEKDSSVSWAALSVIGSMASITCGASIAKGVFSQLGPLGTTSFRLGVAAIFLTLVARPWKASISRTHFKTIAIYGLCLAAMNLFFYLSISKIPLAVAIAIEFLGPLTIALVSSRRRNDIIWVLLAGVGIYLLLPAAAGESLPIDGVVYALCAAVMWALYILAGKRAGNAGPPGVVTSVGMLVGAAAVLPFGGSAAVTIYHQPALLGSVFAIALLSSAIPYVLEMRALKVLPAGTFGVLLSLEPAIGAVFGYLILSEVLQLSQLGAIGCIIVASIGAVVSASRGQGKNATTI